MLVAAHNRNVDEAGDAERLVSVSLICYIVIGYVVDWFGKDTWLGVSQYSWLIMGWT